MGSAPSCLQGRSAEALTRLPQGWAVPEAGSWAGTQLADHKSAEVFPPVLKVMSES